MKRLLLILLFSSISALGSLYAQNCGGGDQNPNGGNHNPIPDPDPYGGDSIDVTQPVDPNEIIGPTGYDMAGTIDLRRWVSATQRLTYTIYFENDPELATAAAQRIEIRHKLHGKANYASFELGDFGFSNQVFTVTDNPVSYQTRLDLRDSMGLYVDLVAGIDIVHNEAFWIFQTVDPVTGLPPLGANEGFLPINDSTHRGEGYVTFSIVPNTAQCVTGDTITAKASITFDVNNAIATNTWVNTIDAAAPSSNIQVTPNVTYDSMLVAFSGSDDIDGSGIKQYRLYVSANGGGYQPAGIYAEGEEARVPVMAGVQYRYVSLAEDNVGNIEPMKSEGDTTIGVSQLPIYAIPMPAEGGVIAGAGVVEQGDTVTLTATANDGYHLARWAEQGVTVENNALYTFVAEQSCTLTAMFERDAYHLWVQDAEGATVTVTDNGGNAILPGASIYHGDTLHIAVQTTLCVTLNGVTVNGQTVTQSTTWIAIDDVTVVPTTTPVAVDTLFYTDVVCVGDDYSGYGFNILSSATLEVDTLTFTAQVQNEAGCPGVAQLTLMVKPYLTITFHPNGGTGTMEPQTICANELGLLTGSGYHGGSASASLQHNGFTKSGNENFEGWALSPTGAVAYNDGDVITTNTDLTLYAQWTTSCVNAYTTDLQIVCDSFAWRGNTYTLSGIYSDTIAGVVQGGCDSVYTLHLTVNNTSYHTDTVTACDRYVWIDDQPYTASNFNSQFTIPNSSGCDSIITLALTILHSDTVYDQQTACNSLTWIDGRTYTESNHTAYVALQNTAGCDSIVRLSLNIQSRWSVSFNANGGVGDMSAQRFCTNEPGVLNSNLFSREGYQFDGWSLYPEAAVAQYQDNDTVALADNVILYAKWQSNCQDAFRTVRTTVCDRYLWREKEYTATGVYLDTVTGVVPGLCDSIYTFDLTVKHKTFATDSRTECPGYEWLNGREYYADNNTSIYRLTNSVGCDSLVTLNLTIRPERTITFVANGGQGVMPDQSICSGNDVLLKSNEFTREGYYFAGWALSENGNAMFTNGDVINLTTDTTLYAVWSTTCVPNYSTSLAKACDEYQWRSKSLTASGVYRDTVVVAEEACDSIYVLHLTLNSSSSTVETREACESFVWWNGQRYTESTTTPTYVMTNHGGCDSTLTLHLTINHANSSVESVTACDSYTWHGTAYATSTTTPTFTTQNAAGCDSVTTLHLTVNYSNTGVEAVTACDSYTWWSTNYTNSTNTPTHTYTNVAGCDSVVTLNLTINYSNTAIESLTACDSLTWHGQAYTASTTTPTFTSLNATGCDSVTTLHLTVNYSNTAIETITTCDSLTWHGQAYTVSTTTPTFTSLNAAGCDSMTTLHLTVNYSNTATETLTTCDSLTWHGQAYTVSTTTPTFTSLNVAGCDSVTTLHLTVNYSNTAIETITTCDSLTWHGTTYTTSTSTPTFTSLNAAGCDSVTTLHLTVNYSNTSIETVTACNSYVWHGTEYFASTNMPTYTTTNAAGCDSVVTLHLTIIECSTTAITACDSYTWHGVTYTSGGTYMDGTDTLVLTLNYSTSATETVTACDSYTWHGTTFTTTGTMTDTLTNAAGCDSVTTLNLTVNYSNTGTETVTACNSFIWHGTEYTASTDTATYTTTNAVGCDSVTTLHLTIIECSTTTITACDSYTWHDSTYTMSGLYTVGTDTLDLSIHYSTTGTETLTACDSLTWHGTTYTARTSTPTFDTLNVWECDSTVTLNLTIHYSVHDTLTETAVDSFLWDGRTLTESGIYSYEGLTGEGCDSIVVLNLIVTHDSTFIDLPDGRDIRVYPNPTSGWLTIEAENIMEVRVFDNQGKLVKVFRKTNPIDLTDLPTGQYLLHIFLHDGSGVKKVIKR